MSDVVDYWDGQAATFDDEPDHGLRDLAVRAAWTALLLPVLPPPPARIADMGCGTGTLAVLLAQAGHRVSGVDLSPRMVERARGKAARAGVEARFSVGDALTPQWPAGTFDALIARHVLWALSDPGLGLDRWLAVLAPAGRLVVIEGCWSTGAGLAASEVLTLLRARGRDATVVALDDPALWGGPISDERYMLVSSGPRAP